MITNKEYEALESAFYETRETAEASKLLEYVSMDSSCEEYRNRRIALQCYRAIYEDAAAFREYAPWVFGKYVRELITKNEKLTDKELGELAYIINETLTYPFHKDISEEDYETLFDMADSFMCPRCKAYKVTCDPRVTKEILNAIETGLFFEDFSENLPKEAYINISEKLKNRREKYRDCFLTVSS